MPRSRKEKTMTRVIIATTHHDRTVAGGSAGAGGGGCSRGGAIVAGPGPGVVTPQFERSSV